MNAVSLEKISHILKGQLLITDGQPQTEVVAVSIDSRQVNTGTLFFAIVGENFDGHDFSQQALNNGAVAVVTERQLKGVTPQIIVSDTRLALATLAHWNREQLKLGVIAITGSSGKTTIKEMTAAILRNCGKVLATQGNLNNALGVPLTLLRLDDTYDFAVVELGASQAGDISYTTHLVKPDVALVSNVAVAHLAGFGSLLGVAKTKGEIFGGLSQQGTAVINLDNEYLTIWNPLLNQHKINYYAIEYQQKADFYTLNLQQTVDGSKFTLVTPLGTIAINLPLLGRHNVSNAVAAATLAATQGATLLQIKKGLEQIIAVPGRLSPIYLTKQIYLLDDTYNANMGSVKAAMQTLSESVGYHILVLGDLAELGAEEQKYHRELGEIAQEFKIDEILTLGKLSYWVSAGHQGGRHFDDKTALIITILDKIAQHQEMTILIKGSRSAAMEEIVQIIQEKIKC